MQHFLERVSEFCQISRGEVHGVDEEGAFVFVVDLSFIYISEGGCRGVID